MPRPIPTLRPRPLLNALLLLAVALLLPLSACTRAPLPPPVVLFDQGHGQRFLVERNGALDLSQFKATLQHHGLTVRASDQETPLSAELLQGVSTLIISGPFTPFSAAELAAINTFLEQGGQLCVMLHVSTPVTGLLNQLKVAVSNGVIREPTNPIGDGEGTNFFVTDLAPHPLTKGLNRINLYGVWALDTPLQANVIARTSPQAWIDLNNNGVLDQPGDAVQAFTVVVSGQVGHGHFVVFGDDAIFQNRFLDGPNQQLADNLATWLKDGSYYR